MDFLIKYCIIKNIEDLVENVAFSEIYNETN